MKKLKIIAVSVLGTLIGPAVFTLAAFTRTFEAQQSSPLSHFVLFFLLGLSIRWITTHSYPFFKYWIPISFSLLFASIFVVGGMESIRDWVRLFLEYGLMYSGYFLGIWATNKPVRAIATPAVGVLFILFVIYPPYLSWTFKIFYVENDGKPKTNLHQPLNIEGTVLQNADGKTVALQPLLLREENVVMFSFIGCRPCWEKLEVLSNNIDSIAQKRSVVIVYNGDKDPFDKYKNVAKEHPDMNILYDSAGILCANIYGYNDGTYPIEFSVDKELKILDYNIGFGSELSSFYLEKLLK